MTPEATVIVPVYPALIVSPWIVEVISIVELFTPPPSKIAVSLEPGTDAPPKPPVEADQFALSEKFPPEEPTQYLFAASDAFGRRIKNKDKKQKSSILFFKEIFFCDGILYRKIWVIFLNL